MAKKRVKRNSSARKSSKAPSVQKGRKIHKALIIVAVIAAVLLVVGLFSDRSYYVSPKERSDAKYLLENSQCFAGMNLDAETANVLVNKYEELSIVRKDDGIHVMNDRTELDYLDAEYITKYGYGTVIETSNILAWKIRGGSLTDDHTVFKGCVLFVDASGNVLLQFGNEYDKNNPDEH